MDNEHNNTWDVSPTKDWTLELKGSQQEIPLELSVNLSQCLKSSTIITLNGSDFILNGTTEIIGTRKIKGKQYARPFIVNHVILVLDADPYISPETAHRLLYGDPTPDTLKGVSQLNGRSIGDIFINEATDL